MAGVQDEPALGAHFPGHPSEAFVGDEPGVPVHAPIPSYQDFYVSQRGSTAPAKRLLAMVAAIVFSGLAAIAGTFLGSGTASAGFLGIIAVVTLGPAIEEVMKIAGILYLAERRPWLIPSWHWLILIAATSGLVFAAIENLLYINVYFPNEAADFATMRWILGPTLHITTALISSIGVARMWRNTHDQGHPPNMAIARPFLITAAVVHALYNLFAVLAEAFGLI